MFSTSRCRTGEAGWPEGDQVAAHQPDLCFLKGDGFQVHLRQPVGEHGILVEVAAPGALRPGADEQSQRAHAGHQARAEAELTFAGLAYTIVDPGLEFRYALAEFLGVDSLCSASTSNTQG